MRCPAFSIYIFRDHVGTESFEDSLAQRVFCVRHIFGGTHLVWIYPHGIFIACTCRDCCERYYIAFPKLADSCFGNTQSHMAFVEVRAVMVFSKDDAVAAFIKTVISDKRGGVLCRSQLNLETVCQQGAPLEFKKIRDTIPKHDQFTVKHCTFRYVAVLKEKYGCFVSEMLIKIKWQFILFENGRYDTMTEE